MFLIPFSPCHSAPTPPKAFLFPTSLLPHWLCRNVRGHLGDAFLTYTHALHNYFLGCKGYTSVLNFPLLLINARSPQRLLAYGSSPSAQCFSVMCATWNGCPWKSWEKFLAEAIWLSIPGCSWRFGKELVGRGWSMWNLAHLEDFQGAYTTALSPNMWGGPTSLRTLREDCSFWGSFQSSYEDKIWTGETKLHHKQLIMTGHSNVMQRKICLCSLSPANAYMSLWLPQRYAWIA